MPTWPNTLPQSPLLDGFRETVPDITIRSTMDQGPAKVRLRTTAAVRTMALTYLMSKDQIAALETFYLATVQGGALSFTFTHPRSNTVMNCRFTRPPEYVPTNGNFFRVAIELEVLP